MIEVWLSAIAALSSHSEFVPVLGQHQTFNVSWSKWLDQLSQIYQAVSKNFIIEAPKTLFYSDATILIRNIWGSDYVLKVSLAKCFRH